MSDHLRPYSTPSHPRDLAGGIAISCEHAEGAPCGNGLSAFGDLESAVGYSSELEGVLRVRGVVGTGDHAEDWSIERAFVRGHWRRAGLELGRDVLIVGPAARTNLAWGDHAPPVDHAHLWLGLPLGSGAAVRGDYVLGRLRDPQRYPGTLVSIARASGHFGRLEVGLNQLLQLGGDGAPSFGLLDFLLEHVRRRDLSASESDSSNRRFGGDVTFRIHELADVRFYYALMFEDIRRARLVDAIRYDADHLFGFEVRGVTVEWHQTGVRSQEHTPRTTGFTNGGFAVGAPLGPDAESFYVGARLDLGTFALSPWFELARLSSDTYEFIVDGPINRTSIGEDEVRYRVGTRVRFPIRDNLWIEGEAMFEHVDDFAFESGATRNNGGLTASIIWYPRGPLGRLSLN